MRFPNKETVERVRKAYPVGCRVELVQMEDMQAPPIGTKGTVRGVDDTASIMVRWDNVHHNLHYLQRKHEYRFKDLHHDADCPCKCKTDHNQPDSRAC